MRTAHIGVRYQCLKCKKHFTTELYKSKHEDTCPGNVHACAVCGQEYPNRTTLHQHQRNAREYRLKHYSVHGQPEQPI